MAAGPKPSQIALDLGHRTARSREDFLVTGANAEAVAAVDRWPDWRAPYLLLVGPPGSGKTHLASVWAERAEAVFIPPHALGAHRFGEPLPAVAVDDADAPDLDEAGLFHLLNAAKAGGTSVLITAGALPGGWGVRLPDLASRLRLAAVATLAPPDDALLARVIVKLFADRQIAINAALAQFILRRVERSLPAVALAVEALDRAAMEGKTRVTRTLAAAVLNEKDGCAFARS